MKMRKARKQDIEACASIEYPVGGGDTEITKDDLTRQIKDSRYMVLVAEVDNKIVGFIAVHKQAWNNSFYIERLYVEKKQRSRGYGSKLLSEVIRKAKQLKSRIIFVDLPPQNKGAMKFYLKSGFQKAGQIKEFYNDTKEPHADILSYIIHKEK